MSVSSSTEFSRLNVNMYLIHISLKKLLLNSIKVNFDLRYLFSFYINRPGI
jgi:hypothetical protein